MDLLEKIDTIDRLVQEISAHIHFYLNTGNKYLIKDKLTSIQKTQEQLGRQQSFIETENALKKEYLTFQKHEEAITIMVLNLDGFLVGIQPYLHDVDLHFQESILERNHPLSVPTTFSAARCILAEFFTRLTVDEKILFINTSSELMGHKRLFKTGDTYGSKECRELDFILKMCFEKNKFWLVKAAIDQAKLKDQMISPISLLKILIKYYNKPNQTLSTIVLKNHSK